MTHRQWGYFRSDIRKVGGGGGAIRFRSDTKSGRGGQFASGPIRKVGGAIRFRSDTKSGGGGAIRFGSDTKSGGGGGGGGDTFVWHKENTLSLIINSITILTKGVLKHFTRARE